MCRKGANITIEYCYIITCEKLDGSNVKVSGDCYHKFESAIKFIKSRSDNPKRTENSMIWASDERIYKVHPLSFHD